MELLFNNVDNHPEKDGYYLVKIKTFPGADISYFYLIDKEWQNYESIDISNDVIAWANIDEILTYK